MKLAMPGGVQIKYLSDDGAGIFARGRDKSNGIYFCVYKFVQYSLFSYVSNVNWYNVC